MTGHRTLQDEAAVARAIQGVLDLIERTLGSRACAPLTWTVISPLARGADRLVARAVLERSGSRLEVVTPFALAEYKKDFDTDADRREFESLLERAARVHELEHPVPAAGDSPEQHQLNRNIGYLRVGERVVDSCEILLAVWNGAASAGVGGTADVVRYAVQRERVVLWLHPGRLDEPARIIREPVDLPDGELTTASSEAFPATAKALSPGYHQQAAYCADASAGALAADVRAARDELVNAARDAGVSIEPLARVLTGILPEFVRADLLAQRYQRKYTRATKGVLYLAAGAVSVAIAQVLFFPDRAWMIGFEVAAMVAVLALWWHGRREAWHEKWRHDRYLAERLRTATFVALAGGLARERRADDPLPFYRGPQHWKTSIVGSLAGAAVSSDPPPPLEPLKRLLVAAWLEGQRRFHARTAEARARQAHRRHWLGSLLFFATLVMAVLHMAGVGHAPDEEGARLARVDLWITFLALVLPVWAGAVHSITSQLELERIAERSRRMAGVLDGIAHRAGRARTHDELGRVVDDAAGLMLVENHEWWVLLSFQDLRLHV